MQPDAQKVAATNVFARSGKGTRVCASPVLLFCLRGEPLGVAVVERRVEMVPFPDCPDRFPGGKRVQNRPNPQSIHFPETEKGKRRRYIQANNIKTDLFA